MEKCRECRTPVKSGAKFCPQCGLQSPTALVCSTCRHTVLATDKFCAHCGGATTPPSTVAASPAPVATAPVASSRPSRLWPETTWGKLLYFVVIAGAAGFGLSMGVAEEDSPAAIFLLPMGLAFSGLVVLTMWRNLFINANALTRPQPVAAGEAATGSGISWKGVFWVVFTLAASKLARDYFRDLP